MIRLLTIVGLVCSGVSSAAFDLEKQAPNPPVPVVEQTTTKKGQPKVAEKQQRLMRLAHDFGKAEGVNPEIVQGVLLMESGAGTAKAYRVANPGPQAYFGAMQIKLDAAKDVLKIWPALYEKYGFQTQTDDEIKAHLILSESFNVEVGTKYLRLLRDQYKLYGRELMNAFNRGAGGVKKINNNTFHYAIGAEQKLAAWKER